MSAYCHREDYLLRYSELNFQDELSLFSYLALAQEAACKSGDELGFGYDALKAQGLGFVVVNTYCKIFKPVVLGENVSVETWPLPPRHVFCERDYRMKAGGETRAALASRWCLVDLKTFSLVPPERLGEVHERCPYNPEKAVDTPSWKIPKIADGREVYRMRVGASKCDHYFHANNCRYAEFFTDCFTAEELSSRKIDSFQIVYARQAKEGDELVLLREDDGDVSVCEARCGGETVAQFRVNFINKTR